MCTVQMLGTDCADDSFTGAAEGLLETKPLSPVKGMQLNSGETEILRKAVEDYFCLCYGKVHSCEAFILRTVHCGVLGHLIYWCDYLDGF